MYSVTCWCNVPRSCVSMVPAKALTYDQSHHSSLQRTVLVHQAHELTCPYTPSISVRNELGSVGSCSIQPSSALWYALKIRALYVAASTGCLAMSSNRESVLAHVDSLHHWVQRNIGSSPEILIRMSVSTAHAHTSDTNRGWMMCGCGWRRKNAES